ncbi:MAG: hypothetical protein HQL87_15265 [Magnetococcales bacterium]|nr:hypothetical protein [Magnetococcales bacterium]
MKETPLPDKASVIRLLLETEGRVMVCLDATHKGVDVPRRFAADPGLMLVFNSTMPQPIHIQPEVVASELRFGGIPHYCIVPYAAIWSVFNPDTNHGLVWPDSMPAGVRDSHDVAHLSLEGIPPEAYAEVGFEAEAAHAPVEMFPVPAKKGPPVLRVIDGDGQAEAAVVADESDKTATRSQARRGHLRLVE